MFGLSLGSLKWIALAVAAAVIAAYIGFLKLEVSHYRTKADDIEAQFNLVIHTQAAKLAQAEATVKAQDEARQREVIAAVAAIDKLKQSNLEEIKKHEHELASCKLPPITRQLFNDPNGSTGSDQKDSAGKANTGDDAGTPNLAELLKANEENKANFNKMRKIIQKFQEIARQNEENLNGASGSTH